MLWFIGLGISGSDSIPRKAERVIEKADFVYLENFTSPIKPYNLKKIRKMTKGKFLLAKRWMVEDGSEILRNAKRKQVVLLSYGDPYIATTHIELRTRAIREKIKTKSIHSASAITSMIGECGLHYYKVGRIATIMNDIKTANTPYNILYKNLIDGNHTILLLEYNQEKNFFLKPKEAINLLIETEKEQKRKVVTNSLFVIVTSRIGFKNQKIIAGKISHITDKEFGEPPHSIIIPGILHFTESDALKVLAYCVDEPMNNSDSIEKISRQMIKKYVPMVKQAIKELSPSYLNSPEFSEVFENAKLYANDAEQFLEEGKDELAILSIGYADGLVDALRISKGIEPK